MAARRKQGTLTKIERSVTSAAKSAVSAADEYVVEPVSRALGLKDTRNTAKTRRPAVKRTAVKAPVKKRAGGSTGGATRSAAKRRGSTAARRSGGGSRRKASAR